MWPNLHTREFRATLLVEASLPEPPMGFAPLHPLSQAGASSTQSSAAFSFPATQQLPKPPVGATSFKPPYSTSNQFGVDDIAPIRIARRVSPTRLETEAFPWGAAPASWPQGSMHCHQTSYGDIPPFNPTSSSLAGAFHDTSNHHDASSYVAHDESALLNYPLGVEDAGAYVHGSDLHLHTQSSTTTEANICFPEAAAEIFANYEGNAPQRRIDADEYMQNLATDSYPALPPYFVGP